MSREEIAARALAPLAWAALGLADTFAQENRRKASLRHARAVLAALDASSVAAAGWRLVPVQATEEMLTAGRLARMNIEGGYGGPDPWSAMIAAAPPHEAG